jgi:RimJ/RimL family protein N-acetyltransferase
LDRVHSEMIRTFRNDFRIWRWCRQNDLITDQDQERWFKRIHEDPSLRMYAIQGSRSVIGVCGLTSIDPVCRRAEFSLYIAPELQGYGYGRKAILTLIDHGFSNLGLNLIYGESFEGNHAQDLFRSIGFKHEGTRRSFYFKEGKFIDADLYSLLFSEWETSLVFKKQQIEQLPEKPCSHLGCAS